MLYTIKRRDVQSVKLGAISEHASNARKVLAKLALLAMVRDVEVTEDSQQVKATVSDMRALLLGSDRIA